jgi:hypothetical protein
MISQGSFAGGCIQTQPCSTHVAMPRSHPLMTWPFPITNCARQKGRVDMGSRPKPACVGMGWQPYLERGATVDRRIKNRSVEKAASIVAHDVIALLRAITRPFDEDFLRNSLRYIERFDYLDLRRGSWRRLETASLSH